MVLPASRFRKRVRLGLFAAAVIFFLLLAAGGRSRPASAVREAVLAAASPVAGAGSRWGVWFTGIPASRVRELEESGLLLAARDAEIAVLRKENESLTAALGLADAAGTQRSVAARVLSYQQSMGRETLVIGAGEEAGVTEGDIVIDAHRLLVGQVSAVTSATAVVTVASNPGATFSGELVPLGGKIIFKGLGGRALALELIPYDTPLRDGDVVRWVREDAKAAPPVFAGRVVRGSASSGGAFKIGRASLLAEPDRTDTVFIFVSP